MAAWPAARAAAGREAAERAVGHRAAAAAVGTAAAGAAAAELVLLRWLSCQWRRPFTHNSGHHDRGMSCEAALELLAYSKIVGMKEEDKAKTMLCKIRLTDAMSHHAQLEFLSVLG